MSPTLAGAEQQGDLFTARRDFRGIIRRDMAALAARLAAEIAAMDQAVRILAKERDLQFAGSPPSPLAEEQDPLAATRLLLDGFARMVFSTQPAFMGMEGFPPAVQATAGVRLLPPADMREALLNALKREDLVALNAQILERQRLLLAGYDRLAARLLPLHPFSDGGMEDRHSLQNVINEIQALDLFIPLLPLYEQHWRTPEKAYAELGKAEKLAPGNFLILTAMAEVLLQLDKPLPALERIGEALAASPEYARAHDVKGAILLRQRLPSLAAESFGKAIALSPGNSAYHNHRASAYLVLENEQGMCSDFARACGLGDCEGLQWAKGLGKCGR